MPKIAARRTPTSPFWIMALLSTAVLINYVDRGSLGLAVPLIKAEFHLGDQALGWLLSAFSITYVLAMTPVGWLADRYGAHRVLAGGLAIWSIATLLTGFAAGLIPLLLLRLLLGVGESTAFPCSSKLIAGQVTPARIGMANGVLAFGYLVGPALGTWVGGHVMDAHGWRPMFWLFGGLSLLWLLPWSRVVVHEQVTTPSADVVAAGADEEVPTIRQILREPGLWGASLGHFTANYTYYFILNWLPDYLVESRGYSIARMADVVSKGYLINAASALLMGWLADRWIRGGRSADLVYKGTMGISHLGTIGCMAGIVLLPEQQSIACLYGYLVLCGIASPGVFAIPQILAGPAAAGRWVGIQNSWGNVAGIVAPSITGILLAMSGRSFVSAFVLAGIVNLLGFVGWVFILPKIAPIRWNRSRAGAPGHAAS